MSVFFQNTQDFFTYVKSNPKAQAKATPGEAGNVINNDELEAFKKDMFFKRLNGTYTDKDALAMHKVDELLKEFLGKSKLERIDASGARDGLGVGGDHAISVLEYDTYR